jgi:tRNA(Ile)-lysidine synthase
VLTAAERAALLAPLAGCDRTLLAVSGGPDSMALLHLAALWARETGRTGALHVATFDHRLRPGSRAEAELVAAQCAARGLPHAILAWEAAAAGPGLQARARAARYAALAAEARRVGAGAIVTAHHADDQRETLLMRLARGSGLAGLAGMRPRTTVDGVALLRPLLGVEKAALVAVCDEAGVPWVEDPSNADPRFARARLRALAEAFRAAGMAPGRWTALARRAARADAALAELAARAAGATATRTPHGAAIAFARLAAEPEEIVLRVLEAEILRVAPGRGPLRLERLEAATARLLAAAAGRAEAATLGGATLRLNASGLLVIAPEKPRARGRAAAPPPDLVHAIDQMRDSNEPPARELPLATGFVEPRL